MIKNFKTWANLNEGVGDKIVSALDKFFTKTTTAKLATKLDGYQRKQLDDVFGAIAMSGEKNLITNAADGIITAIKTSTGVPIPVSQFEKGLTAVIDGKLTVDEFIALLPAKLADGTEVKTLVQKATTGNISKNVSKNLVEYSEKMHDAFLRFERSLTHNPSTKELWDFKFFNLKNPTSAQMNMYGKNPNGLSIKNIESMYIFSRNDPQYSLTQEQAKDLVDALYTKLKPQVLAKYKGTPGEIQAPTSGIEDLMNRIESVWGLR